MTELAEPGAASAGVSDLDLIEAARFSDDTAVAELYRRHRKAALRLARHLSDPVTAEDVVADAFMRVFQAMRDGKGPSVAFRPYLLTSVRNAYVSHIRRVGRATPVDIDEMLGGVAAEGDAVEAARESRTLAEAFRSLPERWQAVIWHTTVEGDDQETVGRLLGIKANAVAALNFRAREGLRRAYLDAHLAAPAPDECRPVREQLPAYVRGRLNRRRLDQVEGHLGECRRCTAAYLELDAVNSRLAAVLGVAVLGAAASGYAATRPPTAGSRAVRPRDGLLHPRRVLGVLRRLTERPLVAAVASVAVLALTVGIALALSRESDASEGPLALGAAEHLSGGPTRATRTPVPQEPMSTSSPDDPGTPARAAPPKPLGAPSGPAQAPSTPHPSPPVPSSTQGDQAPLPSATVEELPAKTTTPSGPTPSSSPSPSPTSPAPTPTPARTTDDLAVGSAATIDLGDSYHLQLEVVGFDDPTVVTFEVAHLVGYELHQDFDFPTSSCVTTAGDPTRIVCALAPGGGAFALDVSVEGPLVATARISAPKNDDPNPANDAVVFPAP